MVITFTIDTTRGFRFRLQYFSGAGMYVENTFSMGEHILGDSGYVAV